MRIQNFRCLRDVDIQFDNITTFIGPNGIGKSSVLRALNWFFNGASSTPLTEDDVAVGAGRRQIVVEVEFSDLTPEDRNALGKYAPAGAETVTIWRRWESGVEKISARAFTNPLFDAFRTARSAEDKRAAYKTLREERPDFDLPAVRSVRDMESALTVWESQNQGSLSSRELSADGHFFGFNGQAVMSGLFDYVFVSADLRAVEETQDSKASVIGRILEQAIDRTAAEEDLALLGSLLVERHSEVHTKHFTQQLADLSNELTNAVEEFTRGRRVDVEPRVPTYKPPPVQFEVSVRDGAAVTQVDRQGHGFQRALIISALELLARRKAIATDRVICLAIEEPELFQHPVQARAFSAALRRLASDRKRGIQVTYATHAPYFLAADGIPEIRRLTRQPSTGKGMYETIVRTATQEDVQQSLAGDVRQESVERNLAKLALEYLPEALFARSVILTEGDTERAVLEGAALRGEGLAAHGVVVAEVNGKGNLALAHAILREFGVPCFVVFDGDKGKDVAKAENRRLLRRLNAPQEDYPSTQVNERYAAFEYDLERTLLSEWPEWNTALSHLQLSGSGSPRKSAALYRHAAINATSDAPQILKDIIDAAIKLAADNA
ncbi:ATP-dependent endonuclease [Nonomuraea bangladeshensis]